MSNVLSYTSLSEQGFLEYCIRNPPSPWGRFPGRFGCQKDHLQFFDNNPLKNDPNIIIFIVEEELTL